VKRVTFVLAFVLAGLSLSFATGTTEQPAGAQQQKIGGSVSVLAVWGGSELDIFNNMVKPFQDRTGITVNYEGTRDIQAVLTTRVQAGNPPDIAGLPGPGQMAEFARQGKLVDLAAVLDLARMHQEYAQSWLDLGTVDGKMVGIFIKAALKGLIWYDPKVMAGTPNFPPKSWDDLMTISQNLAAQGKTPWAVGLESGAASGWPGTDWLEDFYLRMYGPDRYMQWYQGKVPWTSAEVKSVWEAWGRIVANPRMIYGGTQYVLSTNFGQAFAPLFTTPPGAYFHHQATFIESFIKDQFPDLKPVEDYNFFGFPQIDARYAKAVEGAGDLAGMFNDTPQARAFIDYLTTAEAQAYWVRASDGLSPDRRVPLTDYPDPLQRGAASILTSADIVVFDASDMMPSAMNQAFWSAIMSYVQDPSKLDSILADLEKVRQQAY
jgi:alpha-glucoside transport system substrate-binding protein